MKKTLLGVLAIVLVLSLVLPCAVLADSKGTTEATASSAVVEREAKPIVVTAEPVTITSEEVVIALPAPDTEAEGRAVTGIVCKNCVEVEEVEEEIVLDTSITTVEATTAGEPRVVGKMNKEQIRNTREVRSYVVTVTVDEASGSSSGAVSAPMEAKTEEAGEMIAEDAVSGGGGKGVAKRAVSGGAGQGVIAGTESASGPVVAAKTVAVTIEAAEAYTELESRDVKARTAHTISVMDNKIYVMNNNNVKKQIAIMPDRVKEIMEYTEAVGEGVEAVKRVVKSIELEAEEDPVYNVEYEEDAKLFSFIPVKMRTRSKVDAVSGIVKETKRPWWSFLTRFKGEG